jgi:hypothetical protein
MVGFCCDEVYPLGPVQAYVAPVTVGVVKFIGDPAQTGELLEAVGVAGIGFTVTFTVPGWLVHPLNVTVSE